jgi:hypothetical protein
LRNCSLAIRGIPATLRMAGLFEVAALLSLLSSDSDACTKWIGLILYKVGNHSNFYFGRIGLALCHSPYEAVRGWFNDCEQQTIEII